MHWSTRWLILISVFISLILTVIPIPEWFTEYRPDWTALVVLWWNIHFSGKFNVGSAWIVGIGMDLINTSLLGQYALALTITAYLAIRINQQFKLFSLLQKLLTVLLFLLVYRMLLFWIFSIDGKNLDLVDHWKPLLTDLFIWPWLNAFLREAVAKSKKEQAIS